MTVADVVLFVALVFGGAGAIVGAVLLVDWIRRNR